MKLSDFDYYLPKELIAQYPSRRRDSCRMLVLDRRSGRIEHCIFRDILVYLNPGDLLVLNNTRVRTCRLRARRKTGGAVEVFLLRQKHGLCFDVMLRPARVKQGECVFFSNTGITGTLTGANEVTFDAPDADAVYSLGQIPLPPYIKREPEAMDSVYYQTVYAESDGSVASPTAGLHFTKPLLGRVMRKGVDVEHVTLHVGLGTFKPVTSEDIREHAMQEEYYTIPPRAQAALARARASRTARIVCAGTTTCRALESYADGRAEGSTGIFMYPGHRFRLIDCLLTNFHLPRTTLFMLVCAFAGTALAHAAYAEAVREKYRFYSYGDAMLIV